MIRTYATPLAFKTALEQRLRSTAAAVGRDLNRLRQLLVFDRYLTKVFAVLGNAVILKGGMVIELRLDKARTTKDLDLRVTGDPAIILDQLQEAGRLDVGDWLSFIVESDPRHPEIEAEGMIYQGLRFKAQALLAGKRYGSPFGVDVAFGEPVLGDPEEIEGSNFLCFAGVQPSRIRLYPVETHIAEKLHAYTLPRKRPNSRVKDLPDIALLASTRDLESIVLHDTIVKVFEHRGTHTVPRSVPDPPNEWGPVYERIASNDDLRWRSLEDVTQAVRRFLDPVLAGSTLIWKADSQIWIRN